MASHFRIHTGKADENDATARLQSKKVLKPTETERRLVLREVGNKVLQNATNGQLVGKAGGKVGDLQKNHENLLKNVKPRVDTRWKHVPGMTNRPVTRSLLQKDNSNVLSVGESKTVTTTVTTITAGPSRTTASVDAVGTSKPKMVQIIKGPEVQTLKVVNLKREESCLSRNSLTKLKQQQKQRNATASSEAASQQDDETTDLDVPAAQSIAPDTHSHQMLENIENIDINDGDNPFMLPEYVNDIYNYLYRVEEQFALQEKFLDKQCEVNYSMRTILMDWMNEVHHQFKLEIDTYHLTVSIIDRYLQLVKDVPKRNLQLVGITAMFIASKYEELYPPEIHDFVYIAHDTYSKHAILDMEKRIMLALGFQLGKPLPTHFLRRFSKATKAAPTNHLMAKYFLELASIDYSTAHYKPSEIAAAALYISLFLQPNESHKMSRTLWNRTAEYYTRYTLKVLKPIVLRLAKVIRAAPTTKAQSIQEKYSSSKYENISKTVANMSSAIEKLIDGGLRL